VCVGIGVAGLVAVLTLVRSSELEQVEEASALA
jgi:hypothetical protein